MDAEAEALLELSQSHVTDRLIAAQSALDAAEHRTASAWARLVESRVAELRGAASNGGEAAGQRAVLAPRDLLEVTRDYVWSTSQQGHHRAVIDKCALCPPHPPSCVHPNDARSLRILVHSRTADRACPGQSSRDGSRGVSTIVKGH